jgi:putative sigma-54 modulation protein
MRTVVRSRRMELPPEFHAYAQDRVRLALGRFGRRVGRVAIYLSDVNGPKGGVDAECRAVAGLGGLGEITSMGIGADAWSALDFALERLSRAADRAQGQANSLRFRRFLPHQPLGASS